MLDGVPILGIGQSGLLTLVFLFVLTDRLVWHKRLDEKDAEIKALRKDNAELIAQNGLLLKSAVPATNAVMNALHQALENEET